MTKNIQELTFRVIVIAVVLTLILTVSNVFLALKIGMLTSASIPAAMAAMGVLHFFKRPSIYEYNLIQTAASAGEAVAGGIVYTIPALVIIHFWQRFDYWENVIIALLGGLLGVVFSIPIRRVLVSDKTLPFPEGVAIAEVLKIKHETQTGLRVLLSGGGLGVVLEFLQAGVQIIPSYLEKWVIKNKIIFGAGIGCSIALVAAGYLIGFEIGASIFLGAVINWILGLPIISYLNPMTTAAAVPEIVHTLWVEKLRYVGIGGMLCAGIVTLLTLYKPFLATLKLSATLLSSSKSKPNNILPRTERDIPLHYLIITLFLLGVLAHFYFKNFIFALATGWSSHTIMGFISIILLFLMIVGFIFCCLTGYFSALVGVSASPGSAIVLAGLLLIGLIVQGFSVSDVGIITRLSAQAISILVVAILTGAAAIANDNIQDLKVGYIIGATPWKQQLMLVFGVIIAAFITPLIMQLLFETYGIADVVPAHSTHSLNTLPAPPAAMLAGVSESMFAHTMPWLMLSSGAAIIFVGLLGNIILKSFNKKLSLIGIGLGMYLPLSSSIPLFLGAVIPLLLSRYVKVHKSSEHNGLLLACGLIAGSALFDVLLAALFSSYGNTELLKINLSLPPILTMGLTLLPWVIIFYGFYYVTRFKKTSTNEAD